MFISFFGIILFVLTFDVTTSCGAGGGEDCGLNDDTTCEECVDQFCETCFVSRHSRGHKAGHKWCDVAEPPPNPYVSKNAQSFSPKSKKETLSLHVESYIRDIARRHNKDWATYNILVQREKDRVNHEELVTQFKLELRDMFERYDKDGSGSIDRWELMDMIRSELCEPVSDDEIDEAMKVIDINGDGTVDYDEFVEWWVVSKLKISDKRAQAVQDVFDKGKTMLLQIGASPDVRALIQAGYARADASNAVDYCPEDPLSWLERHKVKKRSEKAMSLNLGKMFRPPAFIRRALVRRAKRLKKKRMKKMDARREAVRSKLNAKNERLAGLFGAEENDEEDLSGKVVHGCVLCDCDEYLADPHNNNLCAACGHDEAEHTIEYELYYDDELDDKAREEAKISQLIERTMDRG